MKFFILSLIFSCLHADCLDLELQGGLFYGNIRRHYLLNTDIYYIDDIEDQIGKKIKGACVDASWNCIATHGLYFNWEIFENNDPSQDSYKVCVAQIDIDWAGQLIKHDFCNLHCISGLRAAYIKEEGSVFYGGDSLQSKTKTIGPYCGLQFRSCAFLAKGIAGIAYACSESIFETDPSVPYKSFLTFYHVFAGVTKQLQCLQCELGYQLDNWCLPELLTNELQDNGKHDVLLIDLGWRGWCAKIGVNF